jgi:hypothetical protein
MISAAFPYQKQRRRVLGSEIRCPARRARRLTFAGEADTKLAAAAYARAAAQLSTVTRASGEL